MYPMASLNNASLNLLNVTTLNVSNISTNSLGTNASGTLNIGNTNASTINIGTLGTGTINIGKANMSTVINGPLTTNGLIMNTGKNITLQPSTSFVAPTELTMLGGISSVIPTLTLSSATNVVGSIRLTNAGIYIINYSYQIAWSTRPTYFYSNVANNTLSTSLSPVINTLSNWGYTDVGFVGTQSFAATSGTMIIQSTVNNYYNLLIYITGGTGVSVAGGYYNITRIA